MNTINAIKGNRNEELLAFLISDKSQHKDYYSDKGRKFADFLIDSKSVSYGDFVAINRLFDEQEGNDDECYESLNQILTGSNSDILWENLEEKIEDLGGIVDYSFDFDAFTFGFVSEISEVWMSIKDKI